MSDIAHPFPGRVEPGMLLGSHEVLLCVARGGMASVWAARQRGARGFSKRVALKTILPELAVPEFEAMFLEEARLAARIRHPNVCEIFELIEQDGVLALSMEWIDGESLSKILEKGSKTLPVRIAARIVADAARGLHAAHELRDESGTAMNVVHRDVSPQNILISLDGHVKVADFGIAKALGSTREATAVGRVKGKLNYMSAEQARGAPLDRRSDVFSLGVVLYIASVGRHPFRGTGESTEDQLSRLLAGQIVPPSRLEPEYPVGLERIVLRAMSKDPASRFQSAAEMRMALEEWLARSGPLVTEQDVAQAMLERVGAEIEQREAKIQRCLEALPATQSGELARTPPGGSLLPLAAPVAPTVPDGIAAQKKPHSSRPRRAGRALWVGTAVLTVSIGTAALLLAGPRMAVRSLQSPARTNSAMDPPLTRENPALEFRAAASTPESPPLETAAAASGIPHPSPSAAAQSQPLTSSARERASAKSPPARRAQTTPEEPRPSREPSVEKSRSSRRLGPMEEEL